MQIFHTFKEFGAGVLKRAYWFIPALLSRPLDIFDIVAGTRLSIPADWLPVLLAFCFFIAALLTYHDLRKKKLATDQHLEEATSRKLQIIFGNGDPFEQEKSVTDSNYNVGTLRLFRVGIRNAGGASIGRTEVEMETIDPPVGIVCPVPLRIMHDTPPPGQAHRRSFSLDPDQVQYIDVIMKHEWLGHSGHPFIIPHIVSDHTQQIAPARYQMTILAHGEGAISARKKFVAELDGNRLRFYEA
jgi:hypothetical protein